jgi:3-dehydroquinate synthase
MVDMKIKSYRGEYQVSYTEDFCAVLSARLKPGDWLLVDATVMKLYDKQLGPFLECYRSVVLPPKESTKSFAAAGQLISQLIECGYKRSNRLVAIGGGVTQDAVAFVASIIYRGIDWIFVPTTLLAQGDSCIGSKTSVNFAEYKNMLGGFHPPRDIIIDPIFLKTLDTKEVLSGLGEMSHYFLIGGRADFDLARENYDACMQDVYASRVLTKRSLQIKKEMIELDEFDQGPRKIFNYGHSFGHALESYTHYQIPHGIAVAYGMDLANRVSVQLGLLNIVVFQEIRDFLTKILKGSPIGHVDVKKYINLLTKDKKNVSNKLNLVLTSGPGKMFLQEVEPNDVLESSVTECFEHYERLVLQYK